ncbi:MAG: (2E,6E)-farnesyl diphosphate synthase [Gammaproteobacteria bacterium]
MPPSESARAQFARTMQHFQDRAEAALDRALPAAAAEPRRLHEAMRYSVLGGGKRVRPLLVYLAGTCAGAASEALDAPAVAVELIHAYSLIHDDLPAMDDDDLRRGKPTCHRAFDEATAILAGDALQAHAFDVLARDPAIAVPDAQRLEMIATLARASGSAGMAGGQAIDLGAVGRALDLAALENMHVHKTGALIRASVRLGVLAAPAPRARLLEDLDRYAHAIGLAFQVQDDILDVEGTTETLGKPQGSDIARNKPTYPNLLGLDGARAAADRLHAQAVEALAAHGAAAEPLRALADYIVRRDR